MIETQGYLNSREIGPLKYTRRNSYSVPLEYSKKFTKNEITRFQTIFTAFDPKDEGSIDSKDLQQALKELKEDQRGKEAIAAYTGSLSPRSRVAFTEFLSLLDTIRLAPLGGAGEKLQGQILSPRRSDQVKAVASGSQTGVKHSYSVEECNAFSEHINQCLGEDTDLKYLLPLTSYETTGNQHLSLFQAVQDGVLLCKLINEAVPDTIDERAINMRNSKKKKSPEQISEAKPLSIYMMTENQNLAINAARSIGVTVVNVGSKDLIDGRETLVLGLVWQIVKLQLLSKVTLKEVPELIALADEEKGEDLQTLMKLSAEELLLRWVNFHLARADKAYYQATGKKPVHWGRRIANFGGDVKDAHAYAVLMQQIAPEHCNAINEIVADESTSGNSSETQLAKANAVINAAKSLGTSAFISGRDITQGNSKLNLAFTAQLFNTRHGLETMSEEDRLAMMAEMLDDDDGDDTEANSREARAFRMWLNSLNLPGDLYVRELYSEFSSGAIPIFHVFERLWPGCVQWSRVNKPKTLADGNTKPLSRFQCIENGNYCIELGKMLKFSLVNVSGLDLVDGNKKLILALLWQMMRQDLLQLLSSLKSQQDSSTAKEDNQSAHCSDIISEKEIADWACAKVSANHGSTVMAGFRDKSLQDGNFLLDLCSAIKPCAVNWELVHRDATTHEDKVNNAKYVISIARKLGATVFLTFDDIIQVKSKMIMSLVASLMAVSIEMSRTKLSIAMDNLSDALEDVNAYY